MPDKKTDSAPDDRTLAMRARDGDSEPGVVRRSRRRGAEPVLTAMGIGEGGPDREALPGNTQVKAAILGHRHRDLLAQCGAQRAAAFGPDLRIRLLRRDGGLRRPGAPDGSDPEGFSRPLPASLEWRTVVREKVR